MEISIGRFDFVDIYKSIQLMRKYSKCKECGNKLIGDGEGTMEIDDDTFKRTCKCGWQVEITEKDVKR